MKYSEPSIKVLDQREITSNITEALSMKTIVSPEYLKGNIKERILQPAKQKVYTSKTKVEYLVSVDDEDLGWMSLGDMQKRFTKSAVRRAILTYRGVDFK